MAWASWVALAASEYCVLSPQFHWWVDHTHSPLGADLIQEWTAGQLFMQGRASDIYDTKLFAQAQHDPNEPLLRWDEDHYFMGVYPPAYYFWMSTLGKLPYGVLVFGWLLFSLICLSLALRWIASHAQNSQIQWGFVGAVCFFSFGLDQFDDGAERVGMDGDSRSFLVLASSKETLGRRGSVRIALHQAHAILSGPHSHVAQSPVSFCVRRSDDDDGALRHGCTLDAMGYLACFFRCCDAERFVSSSEWIRLFMELQLVVADGASSARRAEP